MSLNVRAVHIDWGQPGTLAVTLSGERDHAPVHLSLDYDMARQLAKWLDAAATLPEPLPAPPSQILP